MLRFLAISGNVAVGKSALTALLSRRWGWQPFFEPMDLNPYVADFYSDMGRWSLHSQICFLGHRARQHLTIARQSQPAVQDRTIYEDGDIFARSLYIQGIMNERDYRVYRQVYEAFCDMLPPPDLIVYLSASVSTLRRRITLRGRSFEQSITDGYLHQLNVLYEEWASASQPWRVLRIPTDQVDFVHCPDTMDQLVAQIESAL
jgi:deoxyadenosine/deoxycytidine kinase